jgi:DNA-binding protein H-NS
MALKSMSVEKLTKLKADVDAVLATKIKEERQALEAELAKLDRLHPGQRSGVRTGARGPVAPKYRNPENPSETWAGRGLRPRWLTAALKGRKKLEDFAISASAKGPPITKKRTAKGRATV